MASGARGLPVAPYARRSGVLSGVLDLNMMIFLIVVPFFFFRLFFYIYILLSQCQLVSPCSAY